MPAEKILIVDDSPDMRDLLRCILEAEGYTVLEACDGLEGLHSTCEQSPDLIFTDLSMPHMSGFELLRALRERQINSPVVLMTFHGSEEVAVEAFRLGVRDYLPKPFRIEDILVVTENALREKRFAHEKEQLNRELMAADAARTSVVTLAHYLNNHLTIIATGLGLIDETLRENYPDQRLLKIINSGLESAIGIQAVLNVMREATRLKTTAYNETTPMLNIDDALKKEILNLRQKSA